MGLATVVFSNQLHYYRKILPIILICGLILLIPIASILLVQHIRNLADMPLKTLSTELIIQHDKGNKEATGVQTKKLVEPFNLHSFAPQSIRQQLSTIPGIKNYSTALILWQLNLDNTLTVVGIDPSDPLVGFRKVEELLTKDSRFFNSTQDDEVLLERHFATIFGYKIGDSFELADSTLKIIGLIDFAEQSNLSNATVFLTHKTALALAGKQENIVNQVFISLTSSADIEKVSQSIGNSYPDFSLISKDNLYKSLSSFNQIVYQVGHILVLALIILALILLIWTIKLYQMEFAEQRAVLNILGWGKSDIRYWVAWDIGFLLLGTIAVASIFGVLTYWGLLPQIRIAPLIERGFQL